MQWPRTALVPSLCLALTALFLFLSGMTALLSTDLDRASGVHTRASWDDDRYTSVTTLYDTRPGDRVRVDLPYLQADGPHPDEVRFYVVEGGQAEDLLAGRDATVIHAGAYPPYGFVFQRPEPPADKPRESTPQGDLHPAVDLVFLHERPAGTSAQVFEQRLMHLRSAVGLMEVTVADGDWVAVQPVWYVGAALSALGGVASTVSWLRTRSSPASADAAEATPLEALVVVQDLTRGYLLGLRNALRVTGVLLVVVGIAGVTATEGLVQSVTLPPGDGWVAFVMLGAPAVVAAALALWGIHYLRVSREVRRWTRTPAPVEV